MSASDSCLRCGVDLETGNGSEDRDWVYLCDECRETEQQELSGDQSEPLGGGE
jgi:hypothetical protein